MMSNSESRKRAAANEPSADAESLDDFEYTLTRRALQQIKAEAWDEGYEIHKPRPDTNPTANPYRTEAQS